MTVFDAILGPCWTHHEVHFDRFGVMWEELILETLSPAGQQGCITISAKHFFSKTLRLGRALPILGLCWGYVGPSGVYVGAMFAHLKAMLGLCWPPGGDFGAMLFSWSHLHSQILLEKAPPWPARHPLHFCAIISLKKLNPAWDGCPRWAPEGPTSGLRGSRKHGAAGFIPDASRPPPPKISFRVIQRNLSEGRCSLVRKTAELLVNWETATCICWS